MEASASTHEDVSPEVSVPGGHDDRRLVMLFLGGVLAIYIAVGAAVYVLVAVLL